MNRFELAKERDLSALLSDAFAVYRGHFGTFIAISAAFVLPVGLIVSGVGLEQLWGPYHDKLRVADTVIPAAVTFLVVSPLATATSIFALRDLAGGERPRAGRSIQAGLEAFTPLFLAIVLAALGIALGLAALLLPGLYLTVRWYFVPQSVVLDGARGAQALSASGRLVQGRWWRTFALIAVANIVATVPSFILLGPTGAIADSTGKALPTLIGQMATQVLALPFVAIVSTLLFYDLKARAASS